MAIIRALQIIRPNNVAAAVLCVAVGHALAGTGPPQALLLVAAALVTAAGNVVNDYFDHGIDAINKPRRPLPSGAVTPREARWLYILLLAAIAACAAVLPAVAGLWIAAWAVLLHLYSSHLKRMYIAGNLVVSLVAASGFMLGAAAAGSAAAGMPPAGLTFFFVLGRELVKDAEDVEGDRAHGARTVPVVSGRRAALGAASAIFILLALAFPVPYFTGTYGPGYLAVMLAAVLPILGVSAALSLAQRSPGAVSLLLKAGMFFGILAFYLGARRPG